MIDFQLRQYDSPSRVSLPSVILVTVPSNEGYVTHHDSILLVYFGKSRARARQPVTSRLR